MREIRIDKSSYNDKVMGLYNDIRRYSEIVLQIDTTITTKETKNHTRVVELKDHIGLKYTFRLENGTITDYTISGVDTIHYILE